VATADFGGFVTLRRLLIIPASGTMACCGLTQRRARDYYDGNGFSPPIH
jgi:hypothetical protein